MSSSRLQRGDRLKQLRESRLSKSKSKRQEVDKYNTEYIKGHIVTYFYVFGRMRIYTMKSTKKTLNKTKTLLLTMTMLATLIMALTINIFLTSTKTKLTSQKTVRESVKKLASNTHSFLTLVKKCRQKKEKGR